MHSTWHEGRSGGRRHEGVDLFAPRGTEVVAAASGRVWFVGRNSLGGNTISRWEAGRNVQTTAMDILLRLIRDVPGSLHYLREHAA